MQKKNKQSHWQKKVQFWMGWVPKSVATVHWLQCHLWILSLYLCHIKWIAAFDFQDCASSFLSLSSSLSGSALPLTACSCLTISYGRVIRRPLPHSNRGVFVLLFLSVKKKIIFLLPPLKKKKKKLHWNLLSGSFLYRKYLHILGLKWRFLGGERTYEIQEQICIFFYFRVGWYKWKCKHKENLWLFPQFSWAFQFPAVSFWYETP